MKRSELNARWRAIYAARETIVLDVIGDGALARYEILAAVRARGTWWSLEQLRATMNTLVADRRLIMDGWGRGAKYRRSDSCASE